MAETIVRCANCADPLAGRFCARCGEKRIGPADHTLRRFAEHFFAAFTNVDGTIFLTVRALLFRPGRLTADYLRGKRKPYIPPLQLFLIANLVFFLLHPLIGSNTLTTDLHTQLHYTWHHETAGELVARRLALRHVTEETYAATFDPAAITLARSLVILLVPVFSLAVMAVHGRQRRHYSAHLVFSLHFGAFWLLLICAVLTLTNLTMHLLRLVEVFPSDTVVNSGVLGISMLSMTVYLFHAAGRVFSAQPGWLKFGQALTLAIVFSLSLQAYRGALFFITFWST
jgi:hypothetical protein